MSISDLPPLTVPASKKRTPYEWAVMLIGCEMAIINTGLGLSLILSNHRRFAAPSFDPIKELMPMHYWGVTFILTGLLAIGGQAFFRYWVITVGHAIAGCICLWWTCAFTLGLSNPVASATGIWAYGGLAATHLTVAGCTLVTALRGSRV